MQNICTIIPVYNEASRLDVQTYFDFVSANKDQSFLFVNDGSSDDSLDVLIGLKNRNPSQIHVLNLERNQGKAEAVRQGVLWINKNLKVDIFGYLDADLAAPLSQISFLCDEFENNNLQISFGSRIKLQGSNIERSIIRHYTGRIFATYSSIILNLEIYDTQCGAKFFRNNEENASIFEVKFLTKWLFDLEIFLRFKKIIGNQYFSQKVKEIPLQIWTEKGGSKITLRDFFVTPFLILKIRLSSET